MRTADDDPNLLPRPTATKPTAAPSRRRGRALVAGALVGTVGLGSGVAFAGWSAGGTGTGYAKSDRPKDLRTVAATPSPQLYPGGTGDLVLTVANDNPFDVDLVDVQPAGPVTSGDAACDAGPNGVTLAGRTGSWLVPARGTATVVLAGAVAMAEAAPDACQDRTFAIPVRLAGVQARRAPAAALLAADRTSITFPATELRSAGSLQQLVVRNDGGQPLTGIGHQVVGPNAFFFTPEQTCPTELGPGASCTYGIRFRPTTVNDHAATLRVSAGGQQVEVGLFGRGTGAFVTASSLPFGSVPVGEVRTGEVRLTNGGDQPSGVPSIVLGTGSTTPQGTFALLSNGCTAALAPGSSCPVVVRYSPTTTGEHRGGVNVGFPNGAGTFGQIVGTGV